MAQFRSSKANPLLEEIQFVSTSGISPLADVTSGDKEEFIISDAYSLLAEVSGSENGDNELEISPESSLELEYDMDENLDNSKSGIQPFTSIPNAKIILFLGNSISPYPSNTAIIILFLNFLFYFSV